MRMTPNQVYQGYYSPPREWSLPLSMDENDSKENFDNNILNIITPPVTQESHDLGFGVGPGLYGSGRFTTEY